MKRFLLHTMTGLALAIAAFAVAGLALDGLAHAGEAPPWGKVSNLGERMILEKTGVCTDGKNHYVVVAPSEKQSTQLFYGDGKTFYRVPLPPWVLSGDSFFEPRFFAKTKNSSFRGLDMRMFASVDYDAKKGTCSASCGERKTDLTILSEDAKKALLGKAVYEAPLHKRAAHHLATTTAATSTSTRGTPARRRRTSGCSSARRGR